MTHGLRTVLKEGMTMPFVDNSYKAISRTVDQVFEQKLEKFANCLLIRMERHFPLLLPKFSAGGKFPTG